MTNTCFVHWLSFTVPTTVSIDWIFEELVGTSKDSFDAQPKGMDGYRSCLTNADKTILILTDGGHGLMGHHCRMTGRACEAIQGRLIEIGQKVLSCGGHIARIDLAVDDFSGLLDLSDVEQAIQQGLCTSRFKASPRIESRYDPRTGNEVGKAARFGQRSSSTFIRIYDKAAEQKEDFHWVRCEIEVKRNNATEIMRQLVNGKSIGDLLFGLLAGYIAFREKNKDTNRSRWPLAPWWRQFLGSVEKVTLGTPRRNHQQTNLDWFVTRFDKTLARAVDTFGPDIILEMYKSGKRKTLSLVPSTVPAP